MPTDVDSRAGVLWAELQDLPLDAALARGAERLAGRPLSLGALATSGYPAATVCLAT